MQFEPWMLVPIAVAAAALLAWLLSRGSEPEDDEGGVSVVGSEGDQESEGSGAGEEESGAYSGEDLETKKSRLIQDIVDSVQFIVTEKVSDTPLPGADKRPTKIPTGNLRVRPMHGFGDFPQLLPRSYGLDDDQFYGRLAQRSLLVREYYQYYGDAANALIMLVDVSGSMDEYGRASWAKELVERLLERCLGLKATLHLVTFARTVRSTHRASNPEEANALCGALDSILYPDGGTDVERALRHATELVEQEQFTEAKILLVTDGTDGVDPGYFEARLKETNCHLHTVCIAGENHSLKSISEQYDHLEMKE